MGEVQRGSIVPKYRSVEVISEETKEKVKRRKSGVVAPLSANELNQRAINLSGLNKKEGARDHIPVGRKGNIVDMAKKENLHPGEYRKGEMCN